MTTTHQPDPSKTWETMTPGERNWTIGELLGASPMRQFWLMWNWTFQKTDGGTLTGRKNLGGLACDSLTEAEDWLEEAKNTKTAWKRKFPEKTSPIFDEREQVEIHEQVWHIRYSETPGGGWDVIEFLKPKTDHIMISTMSDGWWQIVAVPTGGEDITTEAATMAEAACAMAFEILKPQP